MQGDAGTNGAAGTNGVSAFTLVSNYNPNPQPVMPYPIQVISTTLTSGSVIATMASTATVIPGMRLSGTGIAAGTTVASVDSGTQIHLSLQATVNGAESVTYQDQVTVNTTTSTAFLTVGETAYVQNWGYMLVLSIPSSTSVQIENVADSSTNAYGGNYPQGTTLAAGNSIVPGGIQGVPGTIPGGAFLVANNLSEGVPATMRTNIGVGSASLLTSGQIFQVSNNLSEGVGATKRTNLGLGTISTQDASAVAITGGTVNSTLGATTPATAVVTSLTASSITDTGPATISGNTTLNSRLFGPSGAIQSLLAATALSANGFCVRVVGSGGAVTLTATPTITTPSADGQFLLIRGTNDTNTVTFQSEASLAGTKLKLGASTRVLGAGDQLLLAYDSTSGFWYEVSFTNN